MSDNVTIASMTREVFINTRTSEDVKAAIETSARQSGRTTSSYMLWCVAQQDPAVARALGMAKKTAFQNLIHAKPVSRKTIALDDLLKRKDNR